MGEGTMIRVLGLPSSSLSTLNKCAMEGNVYTTNKDTVNGKERKLTNLFFNLCSLYKNSQFH